MHSILKILVTFIFSVSIFATETSNRFKITIENGSYAGSYSKANKVGAGESGEVFCYINDNNSKQIAVKELYTYENEKSVQVEAELTCLIMGFCEYFIVDHKAFIAMPLFRGGIKFCDAIYEIKEDEKLLTLAENLFKSLDAMFKKLVIHADLSRNIMANTSTLDVLIHDFDEYSVRYECNKNEFLDGMKKNIRTALEYLQWFSINYHTGSSEQWNKYIAWLNRVTKEEVSCIDDLLKDFKKAIYSK